MPPSSRSVLCAVVFCLYFAFCQAVQGALTQQQLSEQTLAAESKLQAALDEAATVSSQAEVRIAAEVAAKQRLEAQLKSQRTSMYLTQASIKIATAADKGGWIDEGGAADVYKGVMSTKGMPAPQDVAVKILKGSASIATTDKMREQLVRELNMGRAIRHPNLVPYHGMWQDEVGRHCLVMELLPGGTLHTALSGDGALPWEVRVGWLRDIADGLGMLHDQKPHPIIHRDIKSANVLLTADRRTAKLSDFGLAKVVQTVQTMTGAASSGSSAGAGTTGWKAPETYGSKLCRARVYPASDVFSIGMVIYHTISRKTPFLGKSVEEIIRDLSARFDPTAKSVLKKLKKGKTLEELEEEWHDDNELEDRRPDLDEVEEGCPKRFRGLVQKCWCVFAWNIAAAAFV